MLLANIYSVIVYFVENLVKIKLQPKDISLQIPHSQNLSLAFRYIWRVYLKNS